MVKKGEIGHSDSDDNESKSEKKNREKKASVSEIF